jgi:hypothetical protein
LCDTGNSDKIGNGTLDCRERIKHLADVRVMKTIYFFCFLLGMLFGPEDEDDMFLQIVRPFLNYTALQPRRLSS